MSARHRGRGRGGRNPLAPPFQQLPLHQTPTSPDDTRMDEGQSSPVHTVPAPPSPTTSARESEPFQYPEPRQISADLRAPTPVRPQRKKKPHQTFHLAQAA